MNSTTMAVSVANPRRTRYDHHDIAAEAADNTAAGYQTDGETTSAA